MKALIFPFQRGESLAPLRSLCPDFLFPLAGKPIVEHLLEQLVTAGIRDVTLLCDDRSEEVVHHFGNGERWGSQLAISAVRDQGGLQRMVRAALHGIQGGVVCLPANLAVSAEVSGFLAETVAAGDGAALCGGPGGALFAIAAATLREVEQDNNFETVEELLTAARLKGLFSAAAVPPPEAGLITDLNGFLQAQRDILEGRFPEYRISAAPAGAGLWIGDHTEIDPHVNLVAPVLIGSHCRITGSGQIGPNAVISSFCLVNNSDLICDSLVMSGTVTGPHTELNGMAARGKFLVNLRSGAAVTAPDAFILGDMAAATAETTGGTIGLLPAAVLLLVLLPLGLPLLALSMVVPGMIRAERCLGNRRMKNLTGEEPRLPFTLRQFSFGPLLLRRWPGLFAVLAGDLALVGARANRADEDDSSDGESLFGLDTARGLFHIWEVEGDLPESNEERLARENFHQVTRTFGADLSVLLKAAATFPRTG